MQPVFIVGMQGLGDNIYQRAVMRKVCQVANPVYLESPWPQLYKDLSIRIVKPSTRLHTQRKNIEQCVREVNCNWFQPRPARGSMQEGRINYCVRPDLTILESLCQSVNWQTDAVQFDLPNFRSGLKIRTPYVVIRPATIRPEWMATSRNPNPWYLELTSIRLRIAGFHVVSVADVDGDNEWFDGKAPHADTYFEGGQLTVGQLMYLVQNAAGVVSGVGWAVPACIAYRVPLLLLYGVWGYANGPQRILDPRLDTSLITQLLPKNFCMCNSNSHSCDKTIEDFDAKASDWVSNLAARQIDVAAGVWHRLVPRTSATV